MLVVADEADPPLPPPQHLVDQFGDASGAVHIELVGREGVAGPLVGAVHEQHRQAQAAHHLAVGPVEHLDAHDGAGLIDVKGGGKGVPLQILAVHLIHIEGIAQQGQLLLETVQHGNGEVVGLHGEVGGEQGDLTGSRRGL